MKNKYKSSIYSTYNDYDLDYKDYGKYIDINDYMSEYLGDDWYKTKPSETEEERLAREKAIERNSKINQILGE